MSIYAPEVVVVGEPSKSVMGNSTLRTMLASYIEAGVFITYGAHDIATAGDTTLHLMK